MTLQYSLVFAALLAETLSFLVLAFPAFGRAKARLVRWVTRQPAFQPLKTLVLVIWFLILVLFLDALNRSGELEGDWSPSDTGFRRLIVSNPRTQCSIRSPFPMPSKEKPLMVVLWGSKAPRWRTGMQNDSTPNATST